MAGNISDQTTTLSNLVVERNISAGTTTLGAVTGSSISLTGGASLNTATVLSTLSVSGAATLTSTLTVAGQITATAHLSAASSIAIGAGTAITNSFATSFAVAAMTVTGAVSVSTTATIQSLTTNHFVVVHPPAASGFSEDAVLEAYCSATSTLTLKFSNTSSAQYVQAAATYRLMAFRFSGV